MCLRKIWPQRFLDSPHHLLDGFWGPKDGFFGFSSGGYRERGERFCIQMFLSDFNYNIEYFKTKKFHAQTTSNDGSFVAVNVQMVCSWSYASI